MQELGGFLLETLARLDVWAVLDIILVALVIYGAFSLLRGTTAVTVLYGLLLLLLAVLVVSALPQLAVLNWLLRGALPFLAFMLLVLFQPELRRAMERLGRVRGVLYPTLGHAGGTAMSKVIEQVAAACSYMAERRYGALIVFERSTGLQEYAESGVPINGQVSAELLLSIFFANSPLHDGAAILRGDRVVAAGCLLPLSPASVDYQLGTRHRAALGVTEHSDAFSIVVSEESGAISVANNGRLVGNLDEARLKRVLAILLRPPAYESILPWGKKGAGRDPSAATRDVNHGGDV